jgi:predicted transcriptional regulator of viral defense system
VSHIQSQEQPLCGTRAGDHQIAALAARQHGVVARFQLTALGLDVGAIKYRLAHGRLHRLHAGVYAVGHARVTAHGRWMAAMLACGPGAVLSHHSAAALWELLPRSDTGPRAEATAPTHRRGRRGLVIHFARRLDRRDRTTRHGIPVTTVPRTLLDLAEVLPPRELERAFEEAQRLRLLDAREIARLRRRSHGRHGLRPLARLLAEQRPGVAATRSELERRFLALCQEAGLPPPAVNVRLAGFEVDMLWQRQRLVVELDGHAFHHSRSAFERDRIRDAALQLAGYRVVRITHRRLEGAPRATAATISALLE